MKYKAFVNYNTEKVFICKGKWAKAAVMAVFYGAGVKKLTKILGSTRRAKVLRKVAFGTHKVQYSTYSMLSL